MSTLFSSVSAATGIPDYENMSIAIMINGEDGGQDKTIIVKQEMMETFEIFQEVVDMTKCCKQENGRLALHLLLRRRFQCEVDVQV